MSEPVRYSIDPSASRLSVKVFASGPLAAFGHDPTLVMRDVRGELELNPDAMTSASLHLVVRPEVLSLSTEANESDRREIERKARDEVLVTARYPEIIYECLAGRVVVHSPMQLTLSGDLTLHGVTRPQPVAVRLFVTGDIVRAQGEATVRQSDYGIRPITVAGGMMRVKDELKLTFDIVARQVTGQENGEAGAQPAVATRST